MKLFPYSYFIDNKYEKSLSIYNIRFFYNLYHKHRLLYYDYDNPL